MPRKVEKVGKRVSWRDLVKHTQDVREGDLVTYAQIRQILGLGKTHAITPIHSAISRWKNSLRETRGLSITNVRKTGYRIIADKSARSGERLYKKGRRAAKPGLVKAGTDELDGRTLRLQYVKDALLGIDQDTNEVFVVQDIERL